MTTSTKFILAIAWATLNFSVCLTPGLTQANQSNNLDNKSDPSGSDRGTPSDGNRTGGAPRPTTGGEFNCSTPKKKFTALIYPNLEGLTVDERPTFWIYVPYSAPLNGKFKLIDENDELLYETTLPLPQKPGVISIRFPSDPTVKPLVVGQKYRWRFSIDCNPASPSADIPVSGWIQRVALNSSLNSQLATATPRAKSVLYAANGIWYDALTILGDRLFDRPKDRAIASDWADLLKSAGLDDFINEPIVQRYTP